MSAAIETTVIESIEGTEKGANFCATLQAHSINWRFFNGRMQAEGIYTRQRNGQRVTGRNWTTIDAWTHRQLMHWIGY